MFSMLNFEPSFPKISNIFYESGVPYHFLVEIKLPCQKPILRHRIRSTKWTYHRERGFDPNYLIFLENLTRV